MRAVIQRVRNASVTVDSTVTGRIDLGLLVYLGIAAKDSKDDALWLEEKISNLRIFNDENGKMNRSLCDIAFENKNEELTIGMLTVSQFTLIADVKKGRRPYYGDAADPLLANSLYSFFLDLIKKRGLNSQSGVFQAKMDVSYTNE